MLRKLLEGRLVFTPMADGTAVEFRGTGVLDPVLRGIVDGDGLPKASGSRWGFEPVHLAGKGSRARAAPLGAGARAAGVEGMSRIMNLPVEVGHQAVAKPAELGRHELSSRPRWMSMRTG